MASLKTPSKRKKAVQPTPKTSGTKADIWQEYVALMVSKTVTDNEGNQTVVQRSHTSKRKCKY